MAVQTEGNYLNDVLKFELENHHSRGNVTVLSGEDLSMAAVIGKQKLSIPTTGTADGGNTGNGTLTGVTGGTKVQKGTYTLECESVVSGTMTVPATGTADGGNTGDGLCASVADGGAAKAGVYTLTCVDAETNAGAFEVVDPSGLSLGEALVGVAFSNAQIDLTISDGATDFAVGDKFTITVTEGDHDSGVFSVKAPDGSKLPNATAGTAFTNEQINLTLNDGATDFVVGDKFTIAVADGAGKVKEIDFTAVDGTQEAYGFVIAAYDASAADVPGVAIVRDAQIVDGNLVWPTGATAGQKAAALAEMKAMGIVTRTDA